MAYEFEVFLSYKSNPFGPWVHACLVPLLEQYLPEALNNPDAKLFVDKDGISSGDDWLKRIYRALAHSKCLVAVWSPLYFQSDWCLLECGVMHYRGLQLGYRTVEKPRGLILPINVFDGKHFPDFAKKIQYLDCTMFATISFAYGNTTTFMELERLIRKWIQDDVVAAINDAPPWSKEWQTTQWLLNAYNAMKDAHHTTKRNFETPILE